MEHICVYMFRLIALAPFSVVREAEQFSDTFVNGSGLQEYVQALLYPLSQDGAEQEEKGWQLGSPRSARWIISSGQVRSHRFPKTLMMILSDMGFHRVNFERNSLIMQNNHSDTVGDTHHSYIFLNLTIRLHLIVSTRELAKTQTQAIAHVWNVPKR